MQTAASKSSPLPAHPHKGLASGESVESQHNRPSSAIATRVKARLSELEFYAFSLADSIRDRDLKEIWDTLQLMAPVVGLASFEDPFKGPDMEQLRFLFGSLESAIAASDVRRTRNDVADMLRAASLA
ncbi:hypothetical protein Pan258_45700 [Symmachiella dynata]|uniref:hypothetical protein n=1 Tax=Symmachiella dynata TaxID=2527995 RepID=UPI001188C541|nr:hypothetical protein [Symmachiella dynata]QDT50492.1 hypothetical protein Pan258_45700 [Symmachiella dynata]